MNSYDIIRPKNRRKTEKKNIPRIDLDFSRVKQSKFKFSISPRKKIIIEKNKNIPTNYHYSNKTINRHKLFEKRISIQSSGFKKNINFNKFRRSIDKQKGVDKRHSLELYQTKTKKFYQKYNLKNKWKKFIRK